MRLIRGSATGIARRGRQNRSTCEHHSRRHANDPTGLVDTTSLADDDGADGADGADGDGSAEGLVDEATTTIEKRHASRGRTPEFRHHRSLFRRFLPPVSAPRG